MKRRNLKIGPTPGDDFEMLLFVLTLEVCFARLHLQMARQIAKASSDKPHALHVAPTFFAMTFRAHLESTYARAARLFDPASGTATVPSMVRTAEKKAGTFQHANASEMRNKVKVWNNRIASTQPLLVKLQDLRNGLIAHLDTEVILNPKEMDKTVAVTFDEVEQVLNTAREIVKDALDAYNNSAYIDELESAEDWEAILRILDTLSAAPSTPDKTRPPEA